MRLWHFGLIPYLPKSQLIGQWRELNSIFKKEDKHILINYIYEYGKEDLYAYTELILNELKERNVKVRTMDKMENYFSGVTKPKMPYQPFKRHHNIDYLLICYFNLKEKFIRGQKDFDKERFERIHKLCDNQKYIL